MNAHRTLDLNNQAVAHLQAGDIRGSMELLRMAFEGVKHKMTSDSQPHARARQGSSPGDANGSCSARDYRSSKGSHYRKQNRSSKPSSSLVSISSLANSGSRDHGEAPVLVRGVDDGRASCDGRRPVIHSVTIFPQQQDGDMCSSSVPGDDTSFLPMFARALVLPASLYRARQHRDLLVAVVLYNIALVNHIQGSVLVGRSCKPLRKALHCYNTASMIIMKHVQQHQTQGPGQTYLLSLAIVYNSAQIHAHLFALREMQACLARLQGLLHFKQACYYRPTQQQQQLLLHEEARQQARLVHHYHEEYTFFYIHAMILCAPRGRELMFAPAA